MQPPFHGICFGQDDKKGDNFEVVDTCELTLQGVGATGVEQAGDGALLALTSDGGDSSR